MSRVLLLSPAPIKAEMAGPAIRFLEFARVLAGAGLEVTLGSPQPIPAGYSGGGGFSLAAYDRAGLPRLLDWAEVIVFQGLVMQRHPAVRRAGKPLVVDLYDPIFLETLHLFRPDDPDGPAAHNFHLAQIIETAAAGDFFMCASPRQRDLWLGFLAALNRVNPATYADDSGLDRLISVVPFGLDEKPPEKTGAGLRALAGIQPEDEVVLWNGGVWDWFSPEPLVEAVGLLAGRRPRVKLVFMGVKNPDPRIPESAALGRVRAAIDRLDLSDRVILNDWTPYGQRVNFLLEAEVGACLYPKGLETDYSFRTRLLDLIWAGTPILCSGGDELGRLVEREGLGLVLADHRPETVAAALEELLSPRFQGNDLKDRARRVAEGLAWPKVARPLVEFCRNPRFAADKGGHYPNRPGARFPVSYYARRVKERLRTGTLWSTLRDRVRHRNG